MPREHLITIREHVTKANASGYYAASSAIAPVQLPLTATDGSIAYMLIAYQLSPLATPNRAVRSRPVSTGGLGVLTMGQSMADIHGKRCCLVANILVHATTAVSRTELQSIFGTVSFRVWLAILDNPEFQGLILVPVHELLGIADVTEAELKHFSASRDENGNRLQSRGTKWLASVLEGAQKGAMQGVDPLMSLKQVLLAGKAAEKEVAKKAAQARKAETEAASSAEQKSKATRKAEAAAAKTEAAAAKTEALAAKTKAATTATAATAARTAAASAVAAAATKKAQPSVIPKASTTPQPRAMSVKKIKEPKADEAEAVLPHATPSPSPSPSLSLLFSLLVCLLSYALKPKSVHLLPAG